MVPESFSKCQGWDLNLVPRATPFSSPPPNTAFLSVWTCGPPSTMTIWSMTRVLSLSPSSTLQRVAPPPSVNLQLEKLPMPAKCGLGQLAWTHGTLFPVPALCSGAEVLPLAAWQVWQVGQVGQVRQVGQVWQVGTVFSLQVRNLKLRLSLD